MSSSRFGGPRTAELHWDQSHQNQTWQHHHHMNVCISPWCRLSSNVNIPQILLPLKHRCSDIATPQTYPQMVPPPRTSESILHLLPILSMSPLRAAVHFMCSSSNIPLPIGLAKAVASMATLHSTSSTTEAPSNHRHSSTLGDMCLFSYRNRRHHSIPFIALVYYSTCLA